MKRIVRATTVVASVVLLATGTAMSSQGPGVMPGTASASLQLAMAIIVYGRSTLLVGAGLIGAARRH